MKNKKKTYLLLTVVLGVWGIIGYRIWVGLNPETPKTLQTGVTIAFNPKTDSAIDTFSVQTHSRDPFLGTLSIKNKVPLKHKKINNSIIWIPIHYHGIVSKQNQKDKVFVVSIEGQQHLIKVGQEIKGVKLIKGNEANIYVSYKGANKKIIKI